MRPPAIAHGDNQVRIVEHGMEDGPDNELFVTDQRRKPAAADLDDGVGKDIRLHTTSSAHP